MSRSSSMIAPKPPTVKPLIVDLAAKTKMPSKKQEMAKNRKIFSAEFNCFLASRKNGSSSPFITPKRSAAINIPANPVPPLSGNTQKLKPIPMTLSNSRQENALMFSHTLFLFSVFLICCCFGFCNPSIYILLFLSFSCSIQQYLFDKNGTFYSEIS